MANDHNLRPFNKGYDSRRGSKPRGTKHISRYIQEVLEDEQFKLSTGLKLKRMPVKAIINALVEKATNGDLKAIDLLFKHGYGNRLELYLQESYLPKITPEQAEQLLRLRAARPEAQHSSSQ